VWSDKKRLFLLLGGVVVLGLAYVLIHGLPFSGDEEEPTPRRRRAAAARNSNPDGGAASNVAAREKRSVAGKWAPSDFRWLVAVARSPEPEDLPDLREATKAKDPEVRQAAVVGISRLGKKVDTNVLIDRLKADASSQVRAAAAAALGKAKCWEAGPALIKALEDQDGDVRARAGAALRRIMGIDFRYRADDPARHRAIQRIREWWPKFYEGHVQSVGRKG